MLAAGSLAQLSGAALALRIGGPIAAALAAGFTFDRLCERKGLLPPGFRIPWRRGTALALLSAVLWVAVFRPLGEFGLDVVFDPAKITTPQLFLLHGLMMVAMLGWFALGFGGMRRRGSIGGPGGMARVGGRGGIAPAGGVDGEPLGEVAESPPPVPPPVPLPEATPRPAPSFAGQLAAQLGFRAPDVGREIGIGLLLGAGAWGIVVAALIVIAVVIWALHGENALPKEPPAMVPWIAALPIAVRLTVSLSAGFVEETFFRGFLQPRIGIALSTGMFAMAHLSYGQPFMLIGITLLSLIYAFLVRWRQTVWPAIAAHALFDGVQLLIIIPVALRVLGRAAAAGKAVALLLGSIC